MNLIFAASPFTAFRFQCFLYCLFELWVGVFRYVFGDKLAIFLVDLLLLLFRLVFL